MGCGLDEKKMALVKAMGFCDPAVVACDGQDDGVVDIDGQSSAYVGIDGYQQAFARLSRLAGDPGKIDACDIAAIEQDPVALAKAIEGDPVTSLIFDGRAFEYRPGKHKEKEIRPNHAGKGVPPLHYRRMMIYIQLALGHLVSPGLKPTGVFDDATKRAVAIFQKELGITGLAGQPADGGLIGAKTLGLILMRCKVTQGQMFSHLKAAQATGKSFFMGEAKGGMPLAVQGTVVEALKWLGLIGMEVDTNTIRGKQRAIETMQKHFNASMVGPEVIGRLLEKVRASKL